MSRHAADRASAAARSSCTDRTSARAGVPPRCAAAARPAARGHAGDVAAVLRQVRLIGVAGVGSQRRPAAARGARARCAGEALQAGDAGVVRRPVPDGPVEAPAQLAARHPAERASSSTRHPRPSATGRPGPPCRPDRGRGRRPSDVPPPRARPRGPGGSGRTQPVGRSARHAAAPSRSAASTRSSTSWRRRRAGRRRPHPGGSGHRPPSHRPAARTTRLGCRARTRRGGRRRSPAARRSRRG